MNTQLQALHAFALELIEGAFEGGSFEGSEIQDIAVKHGLLKPTELNGACGENCACSEVYGPDDFADGVECYRHTALMELPEVQS